MDGSSLIANWTALTPLARTTFPHFSFPDTAPQSDALAQFLSDLARAHDLTATEAIEILDDLSWQLGFADLAEQAA